MVATKVVSLLELIAKRGAIIRAPTVPGGSASMDWLERWLTQSKEETEQDQENDQEAELKETNRPAIAAAEEQAGIGNILPHSVIATPDMIRARVDFSRDYWRSLIRDTKGARSDVIMSEVDPVPRNVTIQAPSSGEEYLYYAQ